MLPEGTTSLLIDGERVLVQGLAQCLVASKSVDDEWHSVEWDEEANDWTCTCMGWQVRHSCRHVKAISRWAGGKATVRFASDREDLMTKCRSCDAEVVWAKTQAGRKMPLDAQPVEGWSDLRGLFVLRDGVALGAVTAAPRAGEPVYRSHFATCPHANQHRRAS